MFARSDPDLFRVVSYSRMSETLVEQIKTLIRTEQLRPGDRLPSERDLGVKMGVSRVTVRPCTSSPSLIMPT